MTVNGSRAWQPFSSRNAGQPIDLSWHEDVPKSLEHSLREWLDHQFVLDREVRQQVAARLQYVPSEGHWYHDMRGVQTARRCTTSRELRPRTPAGSEIRMLFVFDPTREAIVLVAGDKSGQWNRWYRDAIPPS